MFLLYFGALTPRILLCHPLIMESNSILEPAGKQMTLRLKLVVSTFVLIHMYLDSNSFRTEGILEYTLLNRYPV
jgi:hypothetical protein